MRSSTIIGERGGVFRSLDFKTLRWVLVVLALALACGAPRIALAADEPPDVVFEPLQNHAKGKVQVVGGKTVDPKEWRALVVTKVGEDVDAQGKVIDRTCTASLVGDGVALTAAHCVDAESVTIADPDRRVGIKLQNGMMIILTCRLPEKYLKSKWANGTPRNANDWALCRYTTPQDVPAELKNLRFEVLDLRVAKSPDSVLLTGFGCKELKFDANGRLVGAIADGVFTIAEVAVERSAEETGGSVEIQSAWKSKPALCPGDSGGPLMADAKVASFKDRKVIGVNSAIYPVPDGGGGYDIVSRIAPLSSAAFQAYLATWMSQNTDRTICGAPGAKAGFPCRI